MESQDRISNSLALVSALAEKHSFSRRTFYFTTYAALRHHTFFTVPWKCWLKSKGEGNAIISQLLLEEHGARHQAAHQEEHHEDSATFIDVK